MLTSATEEEMKRIEESVYIPTGIIARKEGGNLIHEGDDNIDINAETIDVKNTFHACRGKRKSLQLLGNIVSLTQA